MEGDDKIAAANGLIYLGDGGRIYSVGGYATDHWNLVIFAEVPLSMSTQA